METHVRIDHLYLADSDHARAAGCAGISCRSPFDEELARSLRFAVKEFPRPAWLNHDLVVWLLAAGVIGSTVAASLFLWTVAVGVNRKSEVRAGATALLVFVIWWIAFAVMCRIRLKTLV